MRYLYVVDFDDTLFRTRVFWRRFLFPELKRIGIPYDISEKVYIASTYKMFGYFIQSLFLSVLHEACKEENIKVSISQINKVFKKTVYSKRARRYFYPRAIEFLHRLKENNNPRILLSSGDKKFKSRFFKALGLNVFFPRGSIHITKKPKIEFIKNLRAKGPVILVNDVLKETEDMVSELQKVSPKTRAFFVDYGGHFKRKDVKKPIELIHSLSEIKVL